jgi:clan AA aspartic protease (TIGR02281 family)
MRSWKLAAAVLAAGVMTSAQSSPLMIIFPDGTRLAGAVGANLIGAGSFKASNAELTCSGKYNAFNLSQLISARVSCTDGREGMAAVQRDDPMGMSGAGILTFSDGQTAAVAWGVAIARLVATVPRPAAKAAPAAESNQKTPDKPLPAADTTPPEFPLDPTGKPVTEVAVALEADPGGTFTVPVFINKSVEVKFFVDSGASDISLPSDVATTLMRNDALVEDDIYGEATYGIADGSSTTKTVIILKEINVGGAKLKNVKASVGDDNAPLLLGQSFLQRFGSWSLDNQRHVLVLKAATPAATATAAAPATPAAGSKPNT